MESILLYIKKKKDIFICFRFESIIQGTICIEILVLSFIQVVEVSHEGKYKLLEINIKFDG